MSKIVGRHAAAHMFFTGKQVNHTFNDTLSIYLDKNKAHLFISLMSQNFREMSHEHDSQDKIHHCQTRMDHLQK